MTFANFANWISVVSGLITISAAITGIYTYFINKDKLNVTIDSLFNYSIRLFIVLCMFILIMFIGFWGHFFIVLVLKGNIQSGEEIWAKGYDLQYITSYIVVVVFLLPTFLYLSKRVLKRTPQPLK